MKKSLMIRVFTFIFLLTNLLLSGQPYKSLAIWPCDGIRAAAFTGMVEVSDGFLAMGYVDTFYNGQYGTGRIWVVKLHPDGSLKWSKFYRDDDPNIAVWGRRLALADKDGAYILAQAGPKGLIIKLDKNGEIVWKKNTIVMPNNSWANELISTADEGVLAVGYTVTSDTGAYVKYYKDGSIAFSGKYKPHDIERIKYCAVDKSFDGGYYLAGIQSEYDPYPVWKTHLLVTKIDGSGHFLWNKAYNGGDELSGDKKKSEGYTISAVPGGGFIAGGLMYKESILNGQAYILRGNDNGDSLWTKNLFEELYPYPSIWPRNSINRIIVKNNEVYAEFVDCVGCSTEKNYLALLNISNGAVQWKQTGYKISDQHIRSLHSILANGQPVFIGGEYYLDLFKHGLILITTPDGLWIPPVIAKFESGADQPELITRINHHIQVSRTVQVGADTNFSSIVYEKTNITKDTVKLDLSSLQDKKYYLRVGITGGKGNTIWSDTMEFYMFSTLKLRYADQVPKFSSEYGGGWSASQIIGLPDVYPNYGDHVGAWSSATADGQREFLECKFPQAAPISGILVFETYSPGAIDTVYVRNPNTQQWVIVYSVTASPAPAFARVLPITFPVTSFPVSEIRLAFNSPAVPGYNEIDAIGLFDATGVGTSELLQSENPLQISPNPAYDQIRISWVRPLTTSTDCILYDATGRQYRQASVPEGNTELNWSIAELPSGNYWVTFRQGNAVQTKSFAKE
ncbi:MAG: T9SS type A sorting domain-containing protein [Saprospiraceae bacterium]